ncbi:MAG: hypothetical protein L3J34_03615 [Flavobacteriaceae bacterium]|nr:hypothetical protein [Flavobacteriaceae bacterium]
MKSLKKNKNVKQVHKSVLHKNNVGNNIYLLILFLILSTNLISAQNDDKNKSFWVHEDVVKLNMASEYETIVKELVALVKKHNLQDVNWIALKTSDARYSYVSSLKNMAELDKPSFVSTLIEKEGKNTVTSLFDRMDKCYDIEHNYILKLDNDLTYMPNGFTQTPEGKNYRKNHILYVSPSNRKIVKEKMKAIKDLFAKKGSKEYYMVAIAAIDEEDYARQSKENNTLLGADGEKVLGDLFNNLLKYETRIGYIRPDLGYSAK